MSIGIDKLKAAILLAVAFYNQAAKVAEGGFKPFELLEFVDEALQLQGVLATKEEILAQLKDLTLEERAEINAAVKDSLAVSADVEEVITDALDWLAASYKLAKSVAAAVSAG